MKGVRKVIDLEKLRELVNEGKDAETIKTELEITNNQKLKLALFELSMKDSKVYEVSFSKARVQKDVSVSKKGRITISDKFVSEFCFEAEIDIEKATIRVKTNKDKKTMLISFE